MTVDNSIAIFDSQSEIQKLLNSYPDTASQEAMEKWSELGPLTFE